MDFPIQVDTIWMGFTCDPLKYVMANIGPVKQKKNSV